LRRRAAGWVHSPECSRPNLGRPYESARRGRDGTRVW
jgi:hypothetical protein